MDTDKKEQQVNEENKQQVSEEELATYEKLRKRVTKTLGELNEKVNAETISQAMDKAVAELKEKGEYSREAIAKAMEALKKDFASTTENMRPRIDKVATPVKEQVEYWLDKGGELWRDIASEAGYYKEISRDKGAVFLLNLTKALGEWSRAVNEKLDSSLQYKTGEMTHGGEFICMKCEGKLHLKKPGRLPPCPKCSASDFRRS